MTKDDVIILPGNVLSRQKRSPQFWACPKNRKKLRGNTRACQARRLAKACQVELMAFVIRGYVHSAHLLAHGHDAAPWICSGDADESFRVGKRQRNEQNSVHQAEDGSVGTDAEGECKDGDGTEAGRLAQGAGGFFEQGRIAESAHGGVAGLFGASARGDVLSDLLVEMKLNFVIQLLGKAVPMKQSLQPKRQSPSPHHRPSLPRSFERHSYRSATIGSTLIARRAGDQDAKSPSKAMAIHALTITSGSRGCISYTTLEIACPTARARVRPTSDPRTSSAAVLPSTSRSTSPGRAPMAMRMPISWVRLETA